MTKERKKSRLVIGISNLITCVIMSAIFVLQFSIALGYRTILPIFTYALPFLAIATLDLIIGIFALKGKDIVWWGTGFALSIMGLIYFLILMGL
jgi:hypothetical protein